MSQLGRKAPRKQPFVKQYADREIDGKLVRVQVNPITEDRPYHHVTAMFSNRGEYRHFFHTMNDRKVKGTNRTPPKRKKRK